MSLKTPIQSVIARHQITELHCLGLCHHTTVVGASVVQQEFVDAPLDETIADICRRRSSRANGRPPSAISIGNPPSVVIERAEIVPGFMSSAFVGSPQFSDFSSAMTLEMSLAAKDFLGFLPENLWSAYRRPNRRPTAAADARVLQELSWVHAQEVADPQQHEKPADAKAADTARPKSAAAAHAAAIFNVVTFPRVFQAHCGVPHWRTWVLVSF